MPCLQPYDWRSRIQQRPMSLVFCFIDCHIYIYGLLAPNTYSVMSGVTCKLDLLTALHT